ncbi:MAG TPA: hypothetical protein VFF65_00275 [Phycisphaerales bacterium]|nr:hypothetical protein [Phycisphaerales bacterium]
MSTRGPAQTGVVNERADPEVVCAQCGYAVGGLRLDAVCPECAFPVEWSLPGGVLKRSDGYGLWDLRAGLGQWCALLVILGMFTAACAVACPALAHMDARFVVQGDPIRALLFVGAAFAWSPLRRLRLQSADRGVRRAGLATVVALAGAAVASAARVSGAGLDQQHAVWERVYEWADASLCVALAAFFWYGVRLSRSVAFETVADRGRHILIAGFGIGGAALLGVRCLLRVSWVGSHVDNLLQREVVDSLLYATDLGGGLLIAGACMVWASVCARTERRVMAHLVRTNAAALNRQLAGAE